MSLVSSAEMIHQKAIGASEIAAVIGISPFAQPWEIAARKRGELPAGPPDIRMRCGLKFQRGIAELFSEDTGIPHVWCDEPFFHPQRDWQRATVDARILPKAALEVKTADRFQAQEWERTDGGIGGEDGIPDYYFAQVQWQISALDLDYAYVAVCIGGNDLRYYLITRDDASIAFLLEQGEEFFYRSILGGEEPPIADSEAARRYLKRKYPQEKEPIRVATDEETLMLAEYAELRLALKPGLKRKGDLEVQLENACGDATGIESALGRFTWKKSKDRTNWQALGRAQLARFPDQKKREIIAEYAEPGSRRLYFRDKRELDSLDSEEE